MHRAVIALAGIVLVVGVLALIPGDGPSLQSAPTTAPPTSPPSASETEAAAVAVVLTPTGVPVPVTGPVPGGWLATSPCGEVVQVTGEPLRDVSIVLDPGHGGPVDTGAVGSNGLREADLNLRLAAATEALLDERGVPTLLTRTGDYAITLPTRVAIADGLGVDAMVSIHHNAPRLDPSAMPGTEAFVQSGSPESSRLGGLLVQSLRHFLLQFDVAWVGARDAGVLEVVNSDGEDAYGMVRRPVTPTVLLEVGYLANPPEAELFASDTYIEVASVAIADAIQGWLTSDQPGVGFGNPPRTRDPAASAAGRECVDPPLG